ncbi:zinc ribbon domain-containing protein [Conexibacter woesei]|uniref:zinc ribbon domain-containing protein n=1 Tax=Conexibacter woesei TaxID=191495 RepID=UPI0004050859|nr:zinc ribbon domain-containing protein [Conexibacter woesei]
MSIIKENVVTTCPSCGAPLAGNQRYCLNCGTRHPEARLEFLDVLDEDVRARSAPPVVVQPHGVAPAGGRLQAHTGLLALASLLVLTLLCGLLVGHWVTDRRSNDAPAVAAPAPQVIRVEGGAATSAAPAATAPATSTPGAGAGAARTARRSDSSDAKTAKAPKGAVSVRSLTSKKAVDDAVRKGKPISTGTGRLPPKDDKAAGGGSAFETIG